MKPEIDTKEVPKTRPEKKLKRKYKSLLESTNDFVELQNLARDFKADLSVFLQKNRRYSLMLLLAFNLSFAQSEIVIGSGSLGNGNFVIGGNIIDVPMLYDNKFTKPKISPVIPKPRTRGKYKKSEAQKLKESLKKKK